MSSAALVVIVLIGGVPATATELHLVRRERCPRWFLLACHGEKNGLPLVWLQGT